MYEPPHWTKPRLAPIVKQSGDAPKQDAPAKPEAPTLADMAAKEFLGSGGWAKELAKIPRNPAKTDEAETPKLDEFEFLRRNVGATMEMVTSLVERIADIKDGMRMMAEQVAGLTARVDALERLAKLPDPSIAAIQQVQADQAYAKNSYVMVTQGEIKPLDLTLSGMPRELFTAANRVTSQMLSSSCEFRHAGGDWQPIHIDGRQDKN